MVNVSTKDVLAQKVEKEEAAKNAQKKKNFGNFEFDERHYLNTRLSKNENEKEIVIRLLPFSNEHLSPFFKIHVHSVRMTNENGEKQWKKFMCPLMMKKSDKCPFCEVAKKSKDLKFENKGNEALYKKYSSVEFANQAKDYWLVRCIDRDHEGDGVKFWRFPDAKNGNGIWDKIVSLIETKNRRGVEILDLYNGKDLVVTVKKQLDSSGKEKMVYQIQDDEKTRPLADTEEQMEKWVNDPMGWEDVYTIKDYDYLSIVVQDEYPVWDKTENKWVAKKNPDGGDNKDEKSEDDSEEEFSNFIDENENTTVNSTDEPDNTDRSDNNDDDDDDDLPF